MKVIFRPIAMLLLAVLFFQPVWSQTPVQVTPQLLPPYSLQVSEYYSGIQPKLQVLLLNRDISQPTIQVKLRLTVESQNCRMQTRANAITPTFTLTSGIPYYMSPSELQPFFAAANIDFSGGYTEQQYVQTGRLPEGLYSFFIEAFELNTGNLVSNKGFSLGWLTLADPPLLNTPARAEGVTPANPQNIIFNWTPRHNTSPTAGYFTDYVFSIAEYNDINIGPEASFSSSPPLFIDSVQATTYLFGPGQPQLVPGKRYAWRVQAKAKSGSVPLAMFRNNGFSEVYWFTYQNNCAAPVGIGHNVQGVRATIEWANNPMHLEWKVEYREKNNPDAQWFTLSNTLPRVMLTDLRPSTQYEYRVGGSCIAGQFTYSALYSFTTAGSPVSPVANCGDSTQVPAGGGQLLQTLNAGDTLRAGTFTVHVGVSSGAGSFTGMGYVKVPWLMNAKVEVRFTNITVSLDRKLIGGVIETTYDPNESGIADIDEYIDIFASGYGVGGVVTGQIAVDTILSFPILWPGGINVTLPPGYNPVTGLPAPGTTIPIVLTNAQTGATTTIQATHLPTTLQDANGNIYNVNANGVATLVGMAGGAELLQNVNRKMIDGDRALVVFKGPAGAKYAFDQWQPVYKKSAAFNKEYEKIPCVNGGLSINEGNYYVSAKAIAPAITDTIHAVVRKPAGSTISKDSIQFVNSKGTRYVKTVVNDSTFAIVVVGGPEKDAQEIYAVYKQGAAKTLNLGKLLVASYPRKEYKLKIISQSGITFNIPGIQDSVAALFNRYNIGIAVSNGNNLINNSWDIDNSTSLDIGSSGVLSSYTDEMKKVIELSKQNNTIENETVYLYYMDKPSVSGVKGDMPFGKQFGFIFSTSGTMDLIRTIAHELGHGLFKLKHTFDYNGFTKGDLQDNLMDYTDGRFLAKAQWDFLHDQGLLTGLFANDQATQSISVGIDLLNKPEFINNTFFQHITFISPAFKPISIPIDKLSKVRFSTCDNLVKANDGKFLGYSPIGTLLGFTYDGEDYTFNGTSSPIFFSNYYCESGKKAYYDKVTAKYKELNQVPAIYGLNVVVALPYWDGTNSTVKGSLFRYNHNYTFQQSESADLSKYTGAGTLADYETQVAGINPVFLNTTLNGTYTNFINGLEFNFPVNFSERSRDFVISISGFARKGMKSAPLIIAHAQKITDYPESDACIQQDEANQFMDELFYTPSGIFIKELPQPTIEQANNLYEQASANINYARITQKMLKSYPTISEGVNSVRVAIRDNKEGDFLSSLIEDVSVCALAQLNGTEINTAIKKISSFCDGNNSREAVIKLLSASVLAGQQEKIMALFESENKVVFNALFKKFKENSASDFGELIYLVYSIYKVVYPSNGYPYPYSLSSNDPRLFRMGFHSDATYSAFGSVTTSQYANGGDYHAIIHRLTRAGGYMSEGRYDFFGEVILDFLTDGNQSIFINNEFKDKRISVPGFFAAYLIDEYMRGQNWRFVRKCIDAGVIVITVASGGAGSVLGLIDITVAGADIVIQNNYDQLNNSSNLSGFYSAFDKMYAAYGLVRALQAMPEIIQFTGNLAMNGLNYAKQIVIKFDQLITRFATEPIVNQKLILNALRLSRDIILRFAYFSKQAMQEASFTSRLLRRLEGKLISNSFEVVPGRSINVNFVQGQGIVVQEGAISNVIADIGNDSKGGFISEFAAYESGSLEYVGKLKDVRFKINGAVKEGEIWIYKNGNKFVSNLSGVFRKSYFNSITGFSDNISTLASQQGINLTTFKLLQEKPASILSSAELNAVNNIRNSIPQLNSNTIMQKVVPKADIQNYLSGNYKVKGYVTTAADAKHLSSYEDIYYGMRLDYEGSKFAISDGSCGVIRFKATNSGSAIIPKSPVNGGSITDGIPFTGHGFTAGKSGRLSVPEWKMNSEADMIEGAEFWEILSDGTEKLRGIYSKIAGKFNLTN